MKELLSLYIEQTSMTGR